MKLLFLAPYPPYPPRGGGQQRMYQWIRHLARDHELWLLTFSGSSTATEALAPLRNLCHVVTVPAPPHGVGRRLRTLVGSLEPDMALRGRSAAFVRAFDELRSTIPFDVIQAESIEMVQYGAQRTHKGPLYVYDAFNAEYVIQQRAFWTDLRTPRKLPAAAYSFLQWRKLRSYEARLAERFGGMLTVSGDDAKIMHELSPALPIGVVPNGVDTKYFHRRSSSPPLGSKPYVLFTGTLDFRPNIDAVTWFVQAVLPLVRQQQPQIRFAVVGRNPAPALLALGEQAAVEIVGEVVDVRPWFDGASAYVVPMRIGGGVRLKLLEALAMEQPVVATPMGAEGVEGLQPDTHALLASQPVEFAAHVLRVLGDPLLAQRLRAAGRALVVERYDWQSIVPRMVGFWDAWRGAGIRS